jgi:hypothetical protein
MIKFAPHSRTALTRLTDLEKRAAYISDKEHPNHDSKTISGVRNVNCPGSSVTALCIAVVLRFEDYLFARKGRRGKRTSLKWLELIYSSPPSTRRDDKGEIMPCLDATERARIEEAILEGPPKNCPARLGWHIDKKTGRCDLHIVVAMINQHGRPWINDGFGHGGKNLTLEFERIETRTLEIINRSREPQHRILTPREVRQRTLKRLGRKTLAQKLAAADWNGMLASLSKVLQQLGYSILKLTPKRIWLIAKNSKKAIAYNIGTLEKNVKLARERMGHHGPDEISM